MIIPTKYIEERQFMLAGLTKAHTPAAVKPGKGNSGVVTRAGEELWVTYYEAAECKKDGIKGCVYGYVIRDGQEHMASLLALDYSKLSSDIIGQASNSTGKTNPTINHKTFTQYARPVWFGRGFKLSKAASAPAKRRGGIDPALARQRNKDRVAEPRTEADNNITMTKGDAKNVIKAYKSRGAFAEGMYEQLRAAIQMRRKTEHQPPKQTLQRAKAWAENMDANPFEYALYLKWEMGQGRNRREKKEKKRADTWRDKVRRGERFAAEDLSWSEWREVLELIIAVIRRTREEIEARKAEDDDL